MGDNRLALAEDFRRKSDDIKDFFLAHEKDFVVRSQIGSVSAIAVLLRKFDPSGGTSAAGNKWTKVDFTALLGNVHCEGLDEKKKFPKGCNLDIIGATPGPPADRNPVDQNPVDQTDPEKAKEINDAVQAAKDMFNPTERPLRSYSQEIFSYMNGKLDNIEVNSLVMLTGISAKLHKTDTYGIPKIFLNVREVIPIKDAHLEDLYDALGGMGTIGVNPCTLDYGPESGKADRFDDEHPVILDCISGDREVVDPEGTYVTALVSEDENNWKFADQDRSEKPRAIINYWVAKLDKKEDAYIQIAYYQNSLKDFQLINKDPGDDSNRTDKKLKLWKKLGPVIFENLDHKVLCKLDVKKTKEMMWNVPGVSDEEHENKFDYGLSLYPSVLCADIAKTYTKIGIPVSHEWVKSNRRISAAGPGTYRPRKVELVTNRNAYNLLGCKHGEFRVLIGLDSFSELIPILEKVTPELGDELMNFATSKGHAGNPPRSDIPDFNVLTSQLKGKRGNLHFETFFISNMEKTPEAIKIKNQFMNGIGNSPNQKLLEHRPANFKDDEGESLDNGSVVNITDHEESENESEPEGTPPVDTRLSKKQIEDTEMELFEESEEEEEEEEEKPKKKRKIKHKKSGERKKRKYV